MHRIPIITRVSLLTARRDETEHDEPVRRRKMVEIMYLFLSLVHEFST